MLRLATVLGRSWQAFGARRSSPRQRYLKRHFEPDHASGQILNPPLLSIQDCRNAHHFVVHFDDSRYSIP
jgi:hypothetical protein